MLIATNMDYGKQQLNKFNIISNSVFEDSVKRGKNDNNRKI